MPQRRRGTAPSLRKRRTSVQEPALVLVNLDQVAAGVVKHRRHGWPHGLRRRFEDDTQLLQALVFLLNIANRKGRQWNALVVNGLLKDPGGGVLVWLQQQLDVARAVGRDDGQPLELAYWNIFAQDEAEDFGVELAGFFLVVYKDGVEFDFHEGNDSQRGRNWQDGAGEAGS